MTIECHQTQLSLQNTQSKFNQLNQNTYRKLVKSSNVGLEYCRRKEHLKNKLIYVKGPWNKPWEKYITITIGPKHLMDQFLFETDNFLKNASK